mgnify:CR=1 FL=1
MATYINLVNELLRRVNDVVIDTADFNSVKNVQSTAKDAINSSIREILQEAQEWPFTLQPYEQQLTVGTGVYSLPADLSKVDWDTFYLKPFEGTNAKYLPVISYESYLRDFRANEDMSGSGGHAVPSSAYKTQDNKFGITPLPNEQYLVEYRYWSFPNDLVLADDVSVIPDRFKSIIIDGAMMYLMRFRSNDQSAMVHAEKFKVGIKSMRRLIVDSPEVVSSTVLQRSKPSVF